MKKFACGVGVIALLVLGSQAFAQTCQTWFPLGEGMSGAETSNNEIRAVAIYNDGSGPALYVGGTFTIAGGAAANYVAKWDGTTWSDVGGGVSIPGQNGHVNCMAVYDDGSGPALYIGGTFTVAGTSVVNHVARWDGLNWSDVGGGVIAGFVPSVDCMLVFNDGSGDKLYIGGDFEGPVGYKIARWNGGSWSAVSGFDRDVNALAAFDDDGDGPNPLALYAGGDFTFAGDASNIRRVAKWNGANWEPLGDGINNLSVYALEVFDEDGAGPNPPALFAGGTFTSAFGVPSTSRIARWNGSTWSSVGGGAGGYIRDLFVHDDGTGPGLYAGGAFAVIGGVPCSKVARWNGAAWSPLDVGLSGITVYAMTTFDDGDGPVLIAGGYFTAAGGQPASRVAQWGCDNAVPICNDIDINNDGSLFDPQDIDAFLSIYSEGPCVPEVNFCDDIDFNNDTSLFDPCDIDSFLLVFSEGPCTSCGQ